MNDKQASGMTPTRFRAILCISIVLLLIAAVGGFIFFRTTLLDYAAKVNQSAQQASISTNDVATLERLKEEMEDNKVAVTRANNIVADSQSYQYQDQIINDLSIYARAAGVAVSSYNFIDESAAASSTSSQTTTDTAAQATPNPTGLKSTKVSISLKSPANYRSIMKFIHSIERNLTKMQLSGISLSGSPETRDNITVNPLTIEVYIR